MQIIKFVQDELIKIYIEFNEKNYQIAINLYCKYPFLFGNISNEEFKIIIKKIIKKIIISTFKQIEKNNQLSLVLNNFFLLSSFISCFILFQLIIFKKTLIY